MVNAQTGPTPTKALLSAKQVAVLRLVQCNLTSKEIGRHRGVSSYAVDALIERAMQQLGVGTRMEAARWVMRNVPGPYERFVYESQPIVGWGPLAAPTEALVQTSVAEEVGVAEAIALYAPPTWDSSEVPQRRDWWSPDSIGPVVRLALIPATAFFTLAIAFTLLAAGLAASDWVTRNLPSNHQAND